MITSVIITTTGLTLPWRRERPPDVKQKRILLQAARSYPCQGLAVCIIATTLPPELPLQESLSDSTKKCGRGMPAGPSSPVWGCILDSPSSTSTPFTLKTPSATGPAMKARPSFSPGWSFGQGQVRQCFLGDSSSPSPPVRVENPLRTLPQAPNQPLLTSGWSFGEGQT